MKRKNILLLLLLLSACSTHPQPIAYGTDQCSLCMMGIIDQKFGAEVVTRKGKIYKFDSIECMVNYVRNKKISEKEIVSYWVTDAVHPETLLEASKAFFLHSVNFPSPMGGDLSAFATEKDRDDYLSKYGGEAWTWDQAWKNARKIQG